MIRSLNQQEELLAALASALLWVLRIQSEQMELSRRMEHHFLNLSERIDMLQSGEMRPKGKLKGCVTFEGMEADWEEMKTMSMEAVELEMKGEEERVEQPHFSRKVTLKSLKDSERSVRDAMEKLEAFVLRATESALKESSDAVRGMLLQSLQKDMSEGRESRSERQNVSEKGLVPKDFALALRAEHDT